MTILADDHDGSPRCSAGDQVVDLDHGVAELIIRVVRGGDIGLGLTGPEVPRTVLHLGG